MKRETSAGGIVFRIDKSLCDLSKDIINESRRDSSKHIMNKPRSEYNKCSSERRTSKGTEYKIKILMIKDPNDKWVFPKGLIDKSETKEQAAIREVKEETGLKELKIIAPLGQIKFFYKWEGETIFKIVYFFLMETNQKELKHQKEEIKAAEWIPMEEVLEKNGYKNQDEIIKKAIEKITHIMKKKTLKDF